MVMSVDLWFETGKRLFTNIWGRCTLQSVKNNVYPTRPLRDPNSLAASPICTYKNTHHCRGCYLPLEIALKTVEYLHEEMDYVPWTVAKQELMYVDIMLSRTALYGDFQVQPLSGGQCTEQDHIIWLRLQEENTASIIQLHDCRGACVVRRLGNNIEGCQRGWVNRVGWGKGGFKRITSLSFQRTHKHELPSTISRLLWLCLAHVTQAHRQEQW